MLTTLWKHTFQKGAKPKVSNIVFIVYVAATVFALHLGKMTVHSNVVSIDAISDQ